MPDKRDPNILKKFDMFITNTSPAVNCGQDVVHSRTIHLNFFVNVLLSQN